MRVYKVPGAGEEVLTICAQVDKRVGYDLRGERGGTCLYMERSECI